MALVDSEKIIPGFNDDKDDSLKISLQKVDGLVGALCIYLDGYIDTYNSNFFQKKIQKVFDAGYTKLIFICSQLNYVSSTGIGSFTSFLKTVKPKGGDIVLLQIQPKVFEAFQLLGFSQFFTIKDTVDDAITFFNAEPEKAISVFPKVFECPVCSKHLKATHAGRFRCSECKSIIAINNEGTIVLG